MSYFPLEYYKKKKLIKPNQTKPILTNPRNYSREKYDHESVLEFSQVYEGVEDDSC